MPLWRPDELLVDEIFISLIFIKFPPCCHALSFLPSFISLIWNGLWWHAWCITISRVLPFLDDYERCASLSFSGSLRESLEISRCLWELHKYYLNIFIYFDYFSFIWINAYYIIIIIRIIICLAFKVIYYVIFMRLTEIHMFIFKFQVVC